MKKKILLSLLLVFVCLFAVACGNDENKEEKKEEKNPGVQTLKCTQEEDGEKVEISIEQDKSTYKFTKANMTMSFDKEEYEGIADTEDELKEIICTDDEESYKSCNVEFSGNRAIINIELDPEAYEKEIESQEEIEKIDADTFNKLKKEAENEGGSCTIS